MIVNRVFLFSLFTFAMLFSAAVFAQRPSLVVVTDIEDNGDSSLEQYRCLFVEYFISELSTHARIDTVESATISKVLTDLKYKRGIKLESANINALCTKMKANILCSQFLKRRDDRKIEVIIKIFDSTGKVIGNVSTVMASINDSDAASKKLALEGAVMIRKATGSEAVGEILDKSLKRIPGTQAQPEPENENKDKEVEKTNPVPVAQ